MTAYTLYSPEKEQEALALIGETRLSDSVPSLLRQIFLARCGGNISVIGATGIAPIAPNLTKQILIASALS